MSSGLGCSLSPSNEHELYITVTEDGCACDPASGAECQEATEQHISWQAMQLQVAVTEKCSTTCPDRYMLHMVRYIHTLSQPACHTLGSSPPGDMESCMSVLGDRSNQDSKREEVL